jgi:hypothetical protein
MFMTHEQGGGAAALEAWVHERKENDPGIAKWWGLWLSSQGRSEDAYKALDLANDTLSQVLHPSQRTLNLHNSRSCHPVLAHALHTNLV